MKRNNSFALMIFLLGLLFVLFLSVSCELNYKVDKPSIYMISMGCDFSDAGTKKIKKGIASDGSEYSLNLSLNTLKYTVNDAVEIGKGFEAIAAKAGYTFNIKYLLGDSKNSDANYSEEELGKNLFGDPSFENFKKVLSSFKEINSSDILIYYVSSHGGSSSFIDSLKNDSICFAGSAVAFDWVKKCLKDTGATVLIMADTCYSGSLITLDNGVVVNPDVSNDNPLSLIFNKNIKESSGLYCITAGKYSEETWEEGASVRVAFNHGVFTRGLLNAIGWNDKTKTLGTIKALKNNKLTVTGIAKYIYSDVSRDKQHSQSYGGSDDIILFKF